jgi:ferredoxin-nitrite reductase
MAREARALRTPETLDWELVYKRNPVERLKRDKSPLGILGELPALIAAGYESVAEEDLVRLKWWGLYHDKPKIGTFMLRVKLPGGRATPAELRTIGEVSNRWGRGEGELSTRQNVQLHYLELAALPEVFAALEGAGLTTAGACGDAVRNITGCPLTGLAHDELFDATPVLEEAAAFFYGNPDYSDLPRKHKITISACAHRCNAPEINCIALVGVLRDGEPGFAVTAGGGLASVPRLARDLGVFVRPDEALPVLRALLDAWKEDLRYRVSRVKSRMKFMVDDYGAEGMRAELERRLGYALPDFTLGPSGPLADHLGIQAQRDGQVAIGVPVHLGLMSGDQMVRVAELAERHGGDVAITRQQNFVVTGVPEESVADTVAALTELGFPLDGNSIRGASIACTGEPHCNFSVTETKTRLGSLIEGLETKFGDGVAGLRLHLDGCPHACAQHWVGDLGFQGTTVRDDEGKRRQAYDIFLRGGLGPDAAIARPVFRRVPSEELDAAVAGLVGGWIEQRAADEQFAAFTHRLSDGDLGILAGREPAKAREEAA